MSKQQVDAKLVGRVVKLRQSGKTWNEVRTELDMPKLNGRVIRAWLKENGRSGEASPQGARKPGPTKDPTKAEPDALAGKRRGRAARRTTEPAGEPAVPAAPAADAQES
jgi:hypothetical protein